MAHLAGEDRQRLVGAVELVPRLGESGERVLQLASPQAQLEDVDDTPGDGDEGLLLCPVELARLGVEDAEAADDDTLRGGQRRRRVEADPRTPVTKGFSRAQIEAAKPVVAI